MKTHSLHHLVLFLLFLSILLLLPAPGYAQTRWWLDLEGGLVTGTPYNDVRIPGSGGTKFSLPDELNLQGQGFYRLRAGVTLNDRHVITALYAPLTATYTGAFDREILYNGARFAPDETVEARYRFNSYRLTYRYEFIRSSRLRLGVGLTAKIRDAAIRLQSAGQSSEYPNVGFVPLVNFYLGWQPTGGRLMLLLEGDALASKQGRAEDIFAGLAYRLTPKIGLKAGYRVVEGGADNDKVYNFTWINYASAGILLNL